MKLVLLIWGGLDNRIVKLVLLYGGGLVSEAGVVVWGGGGVSK